MLLYSYAAASIKIVCGLQRRSRQRLYDCAPAFVTMDTGTKSMSTDINFPQVRHKVPCLGALSKNKTFE